MAHQHSDEVVNTTKQYYDSEDADNFYYQLWGGEDLHVGVYDKREDTIDAVREASTRAVKKMTDLLQSTTTLDKETKVLDIGSGYGGTARYFARNFGCTVDCLNLSDKENERNKQKNKEQGLDSKLSVYGGNFEALPFSDGVYDIVICEDSLLHSANKQKVLEEVDRVLRKGGHFIFTDPMQADDVPEGVLDPVLKRIHLDSMGSVKKYREMAKKIGWKEVQVVQMPEQIPNHYGSVRNVLQNKYDSLKGTISTDYMDKMLEGLKHWVEKGTNGHLNWGYLHFQKQ
eukprot:gb/GECG01012262.1/.p1 GENE.gb/GECG01012262.1/~~gb/GECG01012262.1/.p1  ORF type:complete len:286 (+),score=45.86 gb/GECG01012262.1/:1-858(+)